MFSLQIQIRNLTPSTQIKNTIPSVPQQECITIRFGPLQTDIIINNNSSSGKRLMLDMQLIQMQNLLKNYAFGLFIQNQIGRFWCILSLEKIKIGEQYIVNGLIFYDDDRKECYHFGVFIKLEHYNPKVPKINKVVEEQMKQQAIIKQNKEIGQKKIKSFLDGRKNVQFQVAKPQKPKKQTLSQKNSNKNIPQSQKMNKKQTKITYGVAQYQPMSNNYTGPQSDDQNGIYIPPVMQFTNHQTVQYKISQPQYTLQNNNQNLYTTNKIQKNNINIPSQNMTVPKFQTFQTYSQFKQHNRNQQQQKIQKQSKKNKKQQLRQLARQQAQKQISKKHNQIMIPIPNSKTGTYQLIPLSNLSQAQLIQYAEKQKLAQQYKKQKQLQKIKQMKKQQKNKKKLQHIGKIQKQRLMNLKNQNIGQRQIKKSQKQKISQQNHQSSSDMNIDQQQDYKPKKMEPKQKQKQKQIYSHQNSQSHITSNEFQDQQHNQQQQQNYQSDFESISNAGSLLKSKRSLQSSLSNSRNKQKKNNKQPDLDGSQSQSMSDYGYSQDFDSFSQSLLSKNKRKVQINGSISEISGSYTSLSHRK